MVEAKEPDKVKLIMIPTDKLFKLVKELKETRTGIPKDSLNAKERIKRYKLKTQIDILNSILHYYGIDRLYEKHVGSKDLANAIEEEGEE